MKIEDSSLLSGLTLKDTGNTETQMLNARKQLLTRYREKLGWTTTTMASKLDLMEIEYIAYENGDIRELPDIATDDILYFLRNHVRIIGG